MLYVPLFFYLFDRLSEGKAGADAPPAHVANPHAPPAVTPPPPAHGD
jgi:hypothetical protein